MDSKGKTDIAFSDITEEFGREYKIRHPARIPGPSVRPAPLPRNDPELSYSDFNENRATCLNTIEKLLSNYAKDKAKERFTPRTLLFNRDGSYAMLLDDREDEEGGVAVMLAPESDVVAQDDYL